MRFETAFRAVLASRRMSQAKLARLVSGGVSPAAVAGMLKKGNPSLNALMPYLDVLGYDVALVPKGTAAILPEGSYVIDGKDAE